MNSKIHVEFSYWFSSSLHGVVHLTSIFFSSECNINFTNSSGFILSPHYPGYYPPETRCHWTINVPPGNIIKLRFLEFHLEDHPSCYNDFIEVYSGQANARRKIGRYCGQRFPAFLLSSSNFMEIMFVSDDKVTSSGMKLYYTSEKSRWLHTSRHTHAAYLPCTCLSHLNRTIGSGGGFMPPCLN